MAKIDPAKIIADYKAAYTSAKGKEFTGSLRYENGWFLLSGGGIFSNWYRYRAAAIKDMTKRLLSSAAAE